MCVCVVLCDVCACARVGRKRKKTRSNADHFKQVKYKIVLVCTVLCFFFILPEIQKNISDTLRRVGKKFFILQIDIYCVV